MEEKEKIYIRDVLNVLDMKTQLNSLDESDKNYCVVKQWEIIEGYSETIPHVKLCLEKELNDKIVLVKKIFNKEITQNLTEDELKFIVDLCKYTGTKKHNGDFLTSGDIFWSDFSLFKQRLAGDLSEKFKKDVFRSKQDIEISNDMYRELIKELPPSESFLSNLTKVKKLNLEQALEADDFFDFLNDEKQEELEKVLDISFYIKDSGNTKVFNADEMKKISDCILERTDIFNDLDNAKNVVKFYYQTLPDLIDKKIKDYTNETNDLKGGYLKKSTPVFSFAYELLKKYKGESKNDFNELKRYVGKITSDILKGTSDWSDAIRVFFGLKNFYDRKESAQLSLNCSLNCRLNEMLNFLYKNRIIKNLTAVTKFSVLENEEFSCSWSEWFSELWRCLRDDFLTFWKNSYNITKAVILKKFLNEFDKISVKLDRTNNKTNNKSASITLSELLKEVNEFIPISETTKLQK